MAKGRESARSGQASGAGAFIAERVGGAHRPSATRAFRAAPLGAGRHGPGPLGLGGATRPQRGHRCGSVVHGWGPGRAGQGQQGRGLLQPGLSRIALGTHAHAGTHAGTLTLSRFTTLALHIACAASSSLALAHACASSRLLTLAR